MGKLQWGRGVLLAGLIMMGCAKKPTVTPPTVEEDALLRTLRERTIPNPLQGRFSIKLQSEKLELTVPPLGGGLIVDRPGKAHLAVLAPVGGPVASLTTDGQALGLMISRGKQWVETDDGQALLRDATEGAVTLDDVVGLMLGLVPLQEGDVRSRELVEAGVQLVAEGPGGTQITAVVDEATATPRTLSVVDKDGNTMVTASYDPFELTDDVWMPTKVELYVAPVDLQVRLKFKVWKAIDSAPDVFGVEVPDGFTPVTFKEFGEAMAAGLGDMTDDDAAQ